MSKRARTNARSKTNAAPKPKPRRPARTARAKARKQPAPAKRRAKAGPAPLKGVSDIRRFFHRNETPIYFISATNFNLLGADEWIKGFKFISYIDCFDGLHPNLMSPQTEEPHEEFQSIEDINNYLLTHGEVKEYIAKRARKGKAGKALFLMFDGHSEKLARKLGLEVVFPSARMRTAMDNKVNTNRIAEKAGVPCALCAGPREGTTPNCCAPRPSWAMTWWCRPPSATADTPPSSSRARPITASTPGRSSAKRNAR
jgi:hypothetical protein